MTAAGLAELVGAFREAFERSPSFAARAPGRVNLIGEHIDYNGGLVLPIAIERSVTVVAAPRADRLFRLRSLQMEGRYEGPLPEQAIESPRWANYVLGVASELEKEGRDLPGMDALFHGDVPVGSGLSSSAAIEVATGVLLDAICGASHDRLDLAQLCRRAENGFVGVSCGLMDQAIAACGKRDTALRLDCSIPASENIAIAFGGRARFLVAHSGVRRGLSASAYNQRCRECAEALDVIRRESRTDFSNLAEVPPETVAACRSALGTVLAARARHVTTEQARVVQAIEALRDADLPTFGRLLDESHASLARDYEVSCPELDDLTAFLRRRPGVYGSRLTGAGFGGATISLVDADRADDVLVALTGDFYRARGIEPLAFYTTAQDGAQALEL